jgi:hypothetical protein
VSSFVRAARVAVICRQYSWSGSDHALVGDLQPSRSSCQRLYCTSFSRGSCPARGRGPAERGVAHVEGALVARIEAQHAVGEVDGVVVLLVLEGRDRLREQVVDHRGAPLLVDHFLGLQRIARLALGLGALRLLGRLLLLARLGDQALDLLPERLPVPEYGDQRIWSGPA